MAGDKTMQKKFLVVTVMAAMLFSVFGCADKDTTRDLFFDKWRIMAKQSKGHSPKDRTGEIKYEDTIIDKPEAIEKQIELADKPLPESRVTLRMHKADLMAVLKALARAADVSIILSPNVTGQVDVSIKDKPFDQVFSGILKSNGLAYMWEGDILRIVTVDDMRREVELKEAQNQQRKQEIERSRVEPLMTNVVKIKFADAAQLSEDLVNFLTKNEDGTTRGSIVVEEHTNSLIINASADDVKKMIRLIERLDRPRRQVRLQAFIVEATKNAALELGVRWGGALNQSTGDNNRIYALSGGTNGQQNTDTGQWEYSGPFGNGFSGPTGINLPASFINAETTSATLGSMLTLAFGQLGGNILELQLFALESDNRLNILTNPSITTLDNQVAFTEDGKRVPYVATNADGTPEVKFEDAVLRLEMTPHVIDAETVKLKVMIKKDEVTFEQTVLGNPTIIKKQTETNLVVRDGETIVISGLSRSRETLNDSGIPGVKDVEGLGWLFKTKQDSSEHQEVLVFITPEILSTVKSGEKQKSLEEIEEELLQKYEKQAKENAEASEAEEAQG